MNHDEPSVNEYKYHIFFDKRVKMPLIMVRIDVIVPILNLEGIEEKLALDLHYSLFKERTWKTLEVKSTSLAILEGISNSCDEVLRQVGIRMGDIKSELVVNDWIEGLSLLANWETDSEFVSWIRVCEPSSGS